MRTMDKASISVFHGNPYMHLGVIDYFDGSVFDLWVLSVNQLIIVPQIKGSVPSIRRVVSHVFESFAEGEVKDFKGML